MSLGKYLSSLNKPELECLKENCHLTDSEEKIFEDLAKGRSRVAIAEKYAMSNSVVSSRIHNMQQKINRLNQN